MSRIHLVIALSLIIFLVRILACLISGRLMASSDAPPGSTKEKLRFSGVFLVALEMGIAFETSLGKKKSDTWFIVVLTTLVAGTSWLWAVAMLFLYHKLFR